MDSVIAVTKDTEAFAMLAEATERFLAKLTAEFDKVVEMTSSHAKPISPLVRAELSRIWSDASNRARRQLELHRFSFMRVDFGAPPTVQVTSVLDQAPRQKAKGGRPPAEFWDEMWATIATALYQGDLQPKRQADIEKAMAGWIIEKGHNASPSTIRARARRLWDKIDPAAD